MTSVVADISLFSSNNNNTVSSTFFGGAAQSPSSNNALFSDFGLQLGSINTNNSSSGGPQHLSTNTDFSHVHAFLSSPESKVPRRISIVSNLSDADSLMLTNNNGGGGRDSFASSFTGRDSIASLDSFPQQHHKHHHFQQHPRFDNSSLSTSSSMDSLNGLGMSLDAFSLTHLGTQSTQPLQQQQQQQKQQQQQQQPQMQHMTLPYSFSFPSLLPSMNGGGSVKYQLPQHPRHTQLMNGSTDGISLQQQQQLPHPGVMSNKRPFLPTMPLGNNTNNGIGMMNHGGGSLPNFNHLMAGLSDIGGGPIMEVPRKKKAAHNSSSNSMLFSSSTQLKKSTSSVSLDSVDSNITDTALVLHCPFEGCTKSFSRQFNLKSHMKSHNTEKPFQCASCPQAFRRCHDLKRHVRSLHTEVKPFGCKSCCKQFSRMDALRRHVSRPASHCFSLEYATQLKKEDGGEELTMDFNAHGEDY